MSLLTVLGDGHLGDLEEIRRDVIRFSIGTFDRRRSSISLSRPR